MGPPLRASQDLEREVTEIPLVRVSLRPMRENTQARIILILGGLAFLAFARPGLMTLDSTEQLTEAREGFFTDAHPPMMAAIWRVLDAIIAGGFLMLVLQGLTFLAGAYLVLRRALSPRAAAIAASLLMLYPPIANPLAFIWKDSLMAGLVLLGAGLVLSPSRTARIAALVCFCIGTAVKYNAFAATFPLVVLLFEWRPGVRPLKRYAIAAGTWLAITVVAMGMSSVLTDRQMHFWHSSLGVGDIAGVIYYDDDLSEDEIRRELAGTGLLDETNIKQRMRAVYAKNDMMMIVVGDLRMWDLPINGKVPAPEPQRDAIARAWQSLVFGHPLAYLRHRWATFVDTLGFTFRTRTAIPPRIMKYSGFLSNLGLPTKSQPYQNKWSNSFRWLWAHTPLFTQWIYVVLGLLLLAFARGHRDILAILASGLLAEASLFFLSASPDYRYSHWTITCTCIAIVMLISRRASAARRASRAAGAPGTAGTRSASPRAAREPPDRG